MGVSNRLDRTRETKAADQGTYRYMSPEQLNGSLSFKSDIWAFGCVMLQFSTGRRPYDGIEMDIMCCLKINSGDTPLEHALKNFGGDDLSLIEDHEDFKQILSKCFDRNYSERPSAEELFGDPFF